MNPISPLEITAMTLVSCLGHGVDEHLQALQQRRSGLKPCNFAGATLSTYIGEVTGVNDVELPTGLAEFNCRNNRLALLCLQQDQFIDSVSQAKQRYGHDRIGLFLGTSTSGVEQTEQAFNQVSDCSQTLPDWFNYATTQETFSVVDFTRQLLGLNGVAQVIATACSSSAKTFATAWRHIESGYCDAAIVGGIDSLCLMTLYGFDSLQLVSSQPCRPGDASRDGLSIGEAAGFILLERAQPGAASAADKRIQLLGFGESSDGYHMSSPHPQGVGAISAMQQALSRADRAPSDIDYINLHGTATPANDSSEDSAVSELFPATPCSSTKGWTGHTLGAAGAIEAIFSILAIRHGLIPGSLQTHCKDPALLSNIQLENKRGDIDHVISNSFGFGGNNCSLLFGAA
jgi:3-oxoacyl-[acyl-carrier-protein] synthase-1